MIDNELFDQVIRESKLNETWGWTEADLNDGAELLAHGLISCVQKFCRDGDFYDADDETKSKMWKAAVGRAGKLMFGKLSESLREGTWSLETDCGPEALKAIDDLRKWLYPRIGDDILFDRLDAATNRIKELIGEPTPDVDYS